MPDQGPDAFRSPSRRAALAGLLGASGVVRARPAVPEQDDRFLNLLRVPDYAAVYFSERPVPLSRSGMQWSASGLKATTEPQPGGLLLKLTAPGVEPLRLHFRWTVQIAGDPLVLGDAWERGYGDLAWRSIVPERILPWYFLAAENGVVHSYGVKTQPAALCFWQLDGEGVSLWLDVSNGGSGVQLGDRELELATVVTRQGHKDETSIEAATAFCRALCKRPRLPKEPLYGSNDWYYAYGKNSAQSTLRDAELVSTLSERNRVKPFTVVDMGWEEGSKAFGSMADLARQMKRRAVRPGLWIRPLEATKTARPELLLPAARFGKFGARRRELAFDPTVPEALSLVTSKVRNPVGWGYELVKHDFSTYDLLGMWGREMGPTPTFPGWHLSDRSRTNAEVILALYRALREAAGEQALLIGCNTIGHLGAGLFEAQRTGDDTSGRDWERTRRMGVNTLAYRLPQHNTFFASDPDCVGITPAIPWELNRQWLDLIARSGTALFISPDPRSTGSEQRAAIKQAFALAASGEAKAEPVDWFRNTTPASWKFRKNDGAEQRVEYRWNGPAGSSPFDV